MRYALNLADISSENIDGEVIIVNLTNGSYYSLRGSSAVVWPLAVAGWSAAEIAAHFESGALLPMEIEAEVKRFLGYLCAENVLQASHDAVPNDIPGLNPSKEFAILEVEKFTDMQELLLLDPIHEVAEDGWPHRDTDDT
jgi:hypothetical protein